MNRRRWKQAELSVARFLGGERVPVSGRERGWAPDVAHAWLDIEVKSYHTRYVVLDKAMDQAEKAQIWRQRRRPNSSSLPLVVYHVAGTPIRRAYAITRLGDFCDWFVNESGEENGTAD